MKSVQSNPILASRHTMGAAVCVDSSAAGAPPALTGDAASLPPRVLDRIASALDFIVREAWSHALPTDGFRPESDTLCSAHWNRIYMMRGAKF